MTNSAAASAFGQWLQSISPKYQLDLTTVSRAGADAGFRSYHRIAAADGRSFIAMNAEGETPESFASFIKVDGLLRNEAGLNAPEIFEADTDHRFMLLSDLGRETYLDVLNEDNARELMDRATTALVAWQKISRPNVLPAYSREVLQRELELFPTWYVGRHRGVEWTEEQQKWWRMTTEAILDTNCREALVFVHRDFMPRNLMVSDPMPGILDFQDALYGPLSYDIASLLRDAFISWDESFVLDTTIRYWEKALVFVHRDFMPRNLMVSDPMPGILDFQDALYGPLSYDIASLLRDAFISWDESFVLDTTIRYWEKARKAGIPVPADFGNFYRDVEFMGVQRHLKVLGIFARLNYRDGKPKYLEDTPRFIQYVRKTARRYIQLSPLTHLIDDLEGSETSFGYTF